MEYSFTIIEVDSGREFRVELFDDLRSEILLCKQPVHNNFSYEIQLDFTAAKDIAIYINGYKTDSMYIDGKIIFSDDKIFNDCFGYVEIIFLCTIEDKFIKLHSEYIPVLVRNNDVMNQRVKAMAKYVYDNCEKFFITGEHKTLMTADLSKDKHKSLMTQITLAKEIVNIYEKVCSYFKANCKFKIDKLPIVDKLEGIQYISAMTLQYIAAHPENLTQVKNTHGIHVGNKIFRPQKSLTLQNVYSNDIYENQTLLWFLKKLIGDLTTLIDKCKRLALTERDSYNSDYDYSASYIFAPLNISAMYLQLQYLQKKCTELFTRYEEAMHIHLSKSFKFSGATKIFQTIPQYNKIFIAIYQWQNLGVYDFSRENFMIRLLTIPLLYERYLLAKMIGYFTDKNYRQLHCESVKYSLYAAAKFKLNDFPNKFKFTRDNKAVTIYYQPVISDGETEPHLYRNNTISVEDDYRGAGYYIPDFVIKFESGGRVKYLIVDAKFSSYDVLKNFRVRELAFKYLFSLSAIDSNEKICGICIMYGKCSEYENLRSIYDRQRDDIQPFFEMLPLMENVNAENHYANLDKLFAKVDIDE